MDINNDVIPETNTTDTNNAGADSVVDSIPEDAQKINSESTASSSAQYTTTQEAAPSSVMAIASLALGIFSVVCCCTVVPAVTASVIGLILGIVSIRGNYGGKSIATAGIIFSAIGLAIGAITGLLGLIGSVVSGIFSYNNYF